MAMSPGAPKRPVGPTPQGGKNPAAHIKKPVGPGGYAKKPPIKGAVKRPGPPPAHHQPQQPERPSSAPMPARGPSVPPSKKPIAPPPPLKSPQASSPQPPKQQIAPPPPLQGNNTIPEKDDDFQQEKVRNQEQNAVVATNPFTVSKEPPVQENNENEEFSGSSEKGRYDNNFAADLNLPPVVLKTKVILFVFLFIFASGLVAGKFFGKSGSTVVTQGLQGVVENPEVPRGRLRCGIAEGGQGCVLYLVNPDRRELEVREFYRLASQLTGVQEFLIQTGNMRYATTRIRPGHFAQINIPPVQ